MNIFRCGKWFVFVILMLYLVVLLCLCVVIRLGLFFSVMWVVFLGLVGRLGSGGGGVSVFGGVLMIWI